MPNLFDAVVVENEVYKGAGRVVYAPSGTAFPTQISDVIDTSTYQLTSAWTDLGGTTEEGIRIVRGFDKDEGVKVDQLAGNIMKGRAINWRGQVAMNLLQSQLEKIKIAHEGSSISTSGNERTIFFGTPVQLTERLLAVIQKHGSSGRHRLFVFRKATLAGEDSEVTISSSDPSAMPVTFDIAPDTGVTDETKNMYALIEES
jgi:hypothetical protein